MALDLPSMDLADAELIKKNFNGRPGIHIESIDLALKRQLETQKSKTKIENDPP